MMNLQTVFTDIAVKELVQVDLLNKGSNQHELNATTALKKFFRIVETKVTGLIRWHYFADNANTERETGSYTFYDARAKSVARTGRSEWRFYYTGEFIARAGIGDVLILLRLKNGEIHGLIIQRNSGWLRAASRLFGLNTVPVQLSLLEEEKIAGQPLDFAHQQILDELDLQVELPVPPSYEEIAVRELELARDAGLLFPKTARMSEVARTLQPNDGVNSDEALLQWLGSEERLFRAIERLLVKEKLDAGFDSVDDFISYSLSVQNRRKSRMGYALQNHLDFLFKKRKLKFETQKTTEGTKRPDFLFPGQKQYLDSNYDATLLLMLAAKSSLKERWAQILSEAARIPHKHLCTLEQAISHSQTEEMRVSKVTLVIPEQLHDTYLPSQQKALLTVEEFIGVVKTKQK